MNVPNFFVVGAPKCGTTSLCDYLGQHPDIFIPRVKEPFFFGSDLTGTRFVTTYEDYLGLFASRTEALRGEGSTWYLYSQCAANEIYKFNPRAKIIIMLRNPVDLLHSLHSQNVYNGEEDLLSFEAALEAEKDRSVGRRLPKNCDRYEALLYSSVVKFPEQIKRYFSRFGRENVHVIIYDSFRLHTVSVFRDTLNFLGARSDFQPVIEVKNGNKRVKSHTIQRLINNTPHILRMASRILPRSLKENVRLKLKNANTLSAPREKIAPELRRQLSDKFRSDILSLSELLNTDLTGWISD